MFRYKKQLAALISAGILCAGLTACGGGSQSRESKSDASSNASNTVQVENSSNANDSAAGNTSNSINANSANASNANASTSTQVAAVDVSSWQWISSTLDCYGYTSKTGPCHLDYQWPNGFQVKESNDSGEQSRIFWFNSDPSKQTQDDAQYYISIMFMQGGYGPTQSTLEPDVEGGLQVRQLGGRDVLFGKLKPTEKPDGSAYTGYTYTYYVPYDDEGWARIWILLTDQEENGLFRQTFENSLRF